MSHHDKIIWWHSPIRYTCTIGTNKHVLTLLGNLFLPVILPPLTDGALVTIEAAAHCLVVVSFFVEAVDTALLGGFIPDFRIEDLAVLVPVLVMPDLIALAGRLLGGRSYTTRTCTRIYIMWRYTVECINTRLTLCPSTKHIICYNNSIISHHTYMYMYICILLWWNYMYMSNTLTSSQLDSSICAMVRFRFTVVLGGKWDGLGIFEVPNGLD